MSIGKNIRTYYYVYILIDPRNDQPFYVGKGFHTRAYAHVTEALKKEEYWTNPHKCRKILKILQSGKKIKYEFMFCENESQAYDMEKQLIQKYGRHNHGGMLTNISEGGECGHPTKKAVCQYDLNGKLINEYESITEAAYEVGLSSPHKLWTMLCNGKSSKHLKTLKGFMFRYKGDPAPQPYKHSQSKTVLMLDDNRDVVRTFESAAKTAGHIGCAASTIRNLCNGNTKQKLYKNHWFIYAEE